MPGVRDASVHTQLVTLNLVELVACIGVLPRANHCPTNICLLVKVWPPDFPWKKQSRRYVTREYKTRVLSEMAMSVGSRNGGLGLFTGCQF